MNRRALFILFPCVLLLAAGLWLWTPDQSRDYLEAKYLQAPDQLITIAGTPLHLRDTGPRDGAPVILLHGFGSSLWTWEAWAEGLEDRFRVIRLDLPGSGLSPPDATNDYSDERAVRLLTGLMDELGVPVASFVGHSMGGRIAWWFAAQQPGRVAKLVLVAPDGYASQGFEYGKAPTVPAAFEVMRYVLPRSFMRMNLAAAYADEAALSDETVELYHDLILAPGSRAALLARTEQTVLKPPEPFLRSIQVPVLLVWGEQDAMIPVANALDYQANLPDARLVRLADAGHVPQEEAPARSLEPVREFLSQPVAP